MQIGLHPPRCHGMMRNMEKDITYTPDCASALERCSSAGRKKPPQRRMPN